MAVFSISRKKLHDDLLRDVLTIDKDGIPSNADSRDENSIKIAVELSRLIGKPSVAPRPPGQTLGARFERACAGYLQSTFHQLQHLRPGRWKIGKLSELKGKPKSKSIAGFEQYEHLEILEKLAAKNPELEVALGADYLIKPDIVVAREPEPDSSINNGAELLDKKFSNLTPLRLSNNERPILHASISCKWTIRSDRAQNARSEGLNLVKNRKGRLPHIAVLVAEPLPSRIASIALGTGEIDCVYHFALPELLDAVDKLKWGDSLQMLRTMIDGKRLRDISDLPLDLAI